MKKIILVLAVITMLTGCTLEGSITESELNDKIAPFEKEILDLKKIVEYQDSILEVVNNSKYFEIADSSIYRLREDIFSDDNYISGSTNDGDGFVKEDFYYSSKNIDDFEVSSDKKYIAIVLKEGEQQHFMFMNHEKEVIFEYSYEAFIKKCLEQDGLLNEFIHLQGFSHDNSMFWGGIGGNLDLLVTFIYQIDSGKFLVFDGSNSDELEDYMNEYPVEW
jgi:hypothetical protein